MKGFGAAVAAGLLGLAGVLVGSLAAQGPDEGLLAASGEGLIFQGRVREMTYGRDDAAGGRFETRVDPGTAARVYPGWVALPESGSFVPADQVVSLSFADGREAVGGDFGDDPQPERPNRPGTFRED